jgi:hypothetical protein
VGELALKESGSQEEEEHRPSQLVERLHNICRRRNSWNRLASAISRNIMCLPTFMASTTRNLGHNGRREDEEPKE